MNAEQYIAFDRDEGAETGKTQIWWVRSVRHGYVLGVIKWYGPWRQYAFFPEPDTIWNTDCMRLVSEKIGYLGLERERANALRDQPLILLP